MLRTLQGRDFCTSNRPSPTPSGKVASGREGPNTAQLLNKGHPQLTGARLTTDPQNRKEASAPRLPQLETEFENRPTDQPRRFR